MTIHAGAMDAVDFRRYDRVWQRVLPTLRPWPDAEDTPPDARDTRDAPPPRRVSGAGDALTLLGGFIEMERAEQRRFAALSRQAPPWAGQSLREMAKRCAARARRLTAVYYLIAGEAYPAAVPPDTSERGAYPRGDRGAADRFRAALRERCHAMASAALRYERAGEACADPCLRGVLEDLNAAAFQCASELLRLLERSV